MFDDTPSPDASLPPIAHGSGLPAQASQPSQNSSGSMNDFSQFFAQPLDIFSLQGCPPVPQLTVDPIQLAVLNELHSMRNLVQDQQAQIEVCKRKLEQQELAAQERNKRASVELPWFRKTAKALGKRKPEGVALTKLRNFVNRVISEALWIKLKLDDAPADDSDQSEEQAALAQAAAAASLTERAGWAKLPQPGQVRKEGAKQSWPCDLTIKFNAGPNAALKTHVVTTVQAGLDHESINGSAITGCPDISVAAIEHVYKKRFEQLAALYKVQTQALAAIRDTKKKHKTRILSSRAHKFEKRLKAVPHYCRLHKGLDPTACLHPDWMSADESAGEDNDLKKLYLDRAKIPEDRRALPKPPKVVATQELKWREDWHGRLLHRLDEYHSTYCSKSPPVHARISGGPSVDSLPKNRPPPCLVKKSWAEGTTGRTQLVDGWEKEANPAQWQKLQDDVESWTAASRSA